MGVQWPLVFFTLLTGLGVSAFTCVAVTERLGDGRIDPDPGCRHCPCGDGYGRRIQPSTSESPISRIPYYEALGTGVGKEMVLIGVTGGLVFLYIILLSIGLSREATRVVASLGLISGIGLAFEMGAIYILPARPVWNTWFWPFIYAASAAVTGRFTMYLGGSVGGRVGPSCCHGYHQGDAHRTDPRGDDPSLPDIPRRGSLQRTSKEARSGSLPETWRPLLGRSRIGRVGCPHRSTAIFRQPGCPFLITVGVVGLIGALIGGIAIRALMYRLGSEADPIL